MCTENSHRCPFVYANGKQCIGFVSKWTVPIQKGYRLDLAEYVRLWCDERGAHASKSRMKFRPIQLESGLYDEIDAILEQRAKETDLITSSDPAAITALAETRRLDALDRDPTDAEHTRSDCLTLVGYSTLASSTAGIADQVEAAIEIEGPLLDPAIRILLETIRDSARKLATLQ